MGVEEEEIQTKVTDNILNRIIAENFSNLEKESHPLQEAYRTPNHQDQKRNTLRCIIIKTSCTENKERIVKAEKEKRQITYKGKPIRIIATQTLNTRKS
jgi:hypothetical protein